MLLRIVYILCLWGSSLAIFGQVGENPGNISGIVAEAGKKTPLEYATVTIFRDKDSLAFNGMVTDITGRFLFRDLAPGNYKIIISFFGYQSITKESLEITPDLPGINVGTLLLQPSSVVLEGVVIEEEKPYMEMNIDKKVYNVEKDLFSKGGTATDVLGNIPSVVVDVDRSISYRGSANVTVLIDGKPSTGTGPGRTASLENIPAELIERIEVISNPSAKYDPDGTAGIINIILKKTQRSGYNGNINVSVGTFHKYNAGITLNFRNKWINLYGSYNFQYNEFRTEGNSRRESFQDSLYYLDQSSSGLNKGLNNAGKIGADFFLDAYNTIGVSANLNQRSRRRTDNTRYEFLDSNRTLSYYNLRENPELDEGFSYDVNAFYKKTYKNPLKSFQLDLNYSRNNGTETLDASQRFFNANQSLYGPGVYLQQTRLVRENHIFTGAVDYVQPIGKNHSLEMGSKITARFIDADFTSHSADSTGNYQLDTLLSNRFKFDEQVIAGYLNWKGKFGKWGISAGLRLEQAFSTSRQITTGEDVERNYFSFFPSAAISYQLKDKSEIQLSYSRRINRPSIEALNPFPDYDDPYNLFRGNPYLKPEFINSAEFSYFKNFKKITLSATIYGRHISGAFTRFRTIDTNGVINTTFENLGNNFNYGLEAVINYNPYKWWRLNLFGNIYGASLDATLLQPGLIAHQIGGSARFTSSFVFWKDFSIQLAYNFMAPAFSAQGIIRPIHSADIAVQKGFFNSKLQVSLRVSDITNTRRWSIVTEGPGFSQDAYRKRESLVGYISISYRFGDLKQEKQTRAKGREGGGGGEMGEDGF